MTYPRYVWYIGLLYMAYREPICGLLYTCLYCVAYQCFINSYQGNKKNGQKVTLGFIFPVILIEPTFYTWMH